MGLRNMGNTAGRGTVVEVAQAADAAGLDSLWVFDHVAIPPEESEGSGGLYLDPLATLAFIAGCTERIGLGTGVMVVPYRPALLTAKWLASIQELSGNRLLIGAAPGWMEAEFRALGVDRSRRGKITDDTLAFIHECFAADIVTANGQEFIFKPRPARPPIYIGGNAPHAIDRALALGDGWIPIGKQPEELAPVIADYRARAAEAGKPDPEIVSFSQINTDDPAEAQATVDGFAQAGVDRLVWICRYETAADCRARLEKIQPLLSA
ncbi:MAG: TIGR03619 family F420-dependent LLM class oxidoreductase [Gammaproteobacteria bacterium]|nr:TIGR03619 family F420-dependent LLM class oxidoreductase [Gammaproteobacteria bacterium]NNL99768.1 TIGR03619 family F420-dependent LLM class oxidoreductase [Gammaproteobacteria bacterium]